MKPFFLSALLAACTAAGAVAQQYDLHHLRTLEGHRLLDHKLMAKDQAPKPSAHAGLALDAEVEQSLEFTSFSMNFFDGQNFMFEGGSFSKYKTTIKWYDDGTVSIDNLFNLRAHNDDNDQELTLWGTYDADSHLISIPTLSSELTPVALLYGELNGYVVAGEVQSDYNFYGSSELVLQVNDDFTEVETQQNALILEEYEGELYTHTCVKYVKMYRAHEGQHLVAFGEDDITFGNPTYPEAVVTKHIYIANVGRETMDYVIDVEDGTDHCPFAAKPVSGTLRTMIMKDVTLSYNPQQPGADEATVTVTSEGGEWSATLSGECVDYPDYSAIVDEGEIAFRTGPEYPFALKHKIGGYVAQSTVWYAQAESWLEAIVEVPAGQLGTLSWRGTNYSDYMWGSKGTVTVDDSQVIFESNMGYEPLDATCHLAEGRHTVRFSFAETHLDFITDDDLMEVSHISFTTAPLAESAFLLPAGNALPFGNFIEHSAASTLRARILNTGSNPLKCLSADDAEHFHVVVNDESASLLDTLYVSVIFEGPEAGQYDEDVVLHTTAGDIAFHCSALVRIVPDYSVIVSPDTDPSVPISWSYSETHPFVIDYQTLEAVNSNACEVDSVATNAWMEASFTIPSGKVGVVTWDASLDIEQMTESGYHDYAMVYIFHPGHQFGIIDVGNGDMSSEGCYGKWEDDKDASTSKFYTAGENSVRWILSHFGDSYYEGTDEFRVSNLCIRLEDFPDYDCRPSVEDIDFGEMLVGRTNSFTLQLTNYGGLELGIDSIVCDAPVSVASVPTYTCPYKIGFDLTFRFEGIEAGEYEGAITIYTTAGEVVLLYTGVVVDPTGYVLAEDFEDEMTWFRSDADGDGKGWNSLYNLYSTMSLGHCHSGEDGLGSSGYYYYLGDVDPDDWCYSPMLQMPAAGQYELSWWIGVDETDADNYAHNYTVYIGEEMNRNTLIPIFTEQIPATGWHHRTVLLDSQWCGKEVCVSFRHFDSKGLGIMKLDDVYLRPATDSAIRNVRHDMTGTRIYNLQGQPVEHLTDGISIVCGKEGVNKVVR